MRQLKVCNEHRIHIHHLPVASDWLQVKHTASIKTHWSLDE